MFNDTMSNCNLHDLGYTRNKFTWADNQVSKNYIQDRLDRFMATDAWMEKYHDYTNKHLLKYSLDHYPMILAFSANKSCRDNDTNKTNHTKFENIWITNEESYI